MLTTSIPRAFAVAGCALALSFAQGLGCSSSTGDGSGRIGNNADGAGGDDSSSGNGPTGNGSTGNGTTGNGTTGNGSTGNGSTGNGSTGNGSTGNGGVGGGSTTSGSSTTGAGAGSTSATTGSGGANGFDQYQQHNLDDVNMYRATLNIAPLVLDQTLCTFALAGAQELSMDHMPHQHFINAINNMTIWQDGFKNSAGENQGDPNGWPVSPELTQIDQIQKAMFDEGPGPGEPHGHYTNMMNAQYTRLGVGLIEISGKLYLTNDFSE